MSVEIEMKFPVEEFNRLQSRLAALGARPEKVQTEVDQYFNGPDRDFARTDEALRIRSVGNEHRITYKGPKRDQQTKTRTEIETYLAEGDQNAENCVSLLAHLGYRPVATVRKRRRGFHLERSGFPVEVCLDDVEGVGQFAEIEIVGTEDTLDQARRVVLDLAKELGLGNSERRSYLEMLLAGRKGSGS
jgi:adenylate cyclase, class 2